MTTNYVLTELVALLTSRFHVPRPQVIATIASVLESDGVEVAHIDPELHAAAWQLLAARPDKSWSLVDCASFVVMRRRGLSAALTTDQHFAQAGFVRLLPST